MPRGSNSNVNIEIEALEKYRSLYNCDTFKDVFRIKTYIEYENSKIRASETSFLDFNDQFLNINKYYLLSRSDIKEFHPRWQFRPNYLSYDIYGTTSFAYLLLFMNDVVSVVEFDFDYVKVPRIGAIKELIITNQRQYPDRSKIKDIQFL